MKNVTTALVTSLALVAGSAAFAETTLEFDDVTKVEGTAGSEVYTSDGKLLGTVSDVDIDGAKATFIMEPSDAMVAPEGQIFVIAQEGRVTFGDDKLTFLATEQEFDTLLSSSTGSGEVSRVLLVD